MCVCVREQRRGNKAETDGKRWTSVPSWPRALCPPPLQRYGSLTCGALAVESVGLVDTLAVVQAGAAGALVYIDLAELPLVAWPISEQGPGGR